MPNTFGTLPEWNQRKNIRWIREFLVNRSQSVVLDREVSDLVTVTSGVPQSFVLGPILFLIYINDLPDLITSKVRLLADDTAVYLTVVSPNDGHVLDRTSVWESRWDMELNPSKCQVVRVTTSRRPINILCYLQVTWRL